MSKSVFHIYRGDFVAARQPRLDGGSFTGGFRLSLIHETCSSHLLHAKVHLLGLCIDIHSIVFFINLSKIAHFCQMAHRKDSYYPAISIHIEYKNMAAERSILSRRTLPRMFIKRAAPHSALEETPVRSASRLWHSVRSSLSASARLNT